MESGISTTMTTRDKCAHEMCACAKPYSPQTRAASTAPLDPNAEFCSPRCATQAGCGPMGEGACECGHPQCDADADAGIPPM